MRFEDPQEVTCGGCSATSMQRVEHVFALRAACPNCGKSFAEVGQRMRSMADDFNQFMDTIEIAMNLEMKLGAEFADEALGKVKTLRDFAHLVETRLPGRNDREVVAVELVLEAARRLPSDPNPEDLDVPLLDSLYPNRWQTAN